MWRSKVVQNVPNGCARCRLAGRLPYVTYGSGGGRGNLPPQGGKAPQPYSTRTRVWRWGVWPTWVLVAIDHFSRAVMAIAPLEGPNAGWVVGAMEEAFTQHGAPRHLISDQEGVFISDAFQDLLIPWDVKQRFGAVGKHGSIAVTERVILTLKYEWLKRVPVIRGLDHLEQLLRDFAIYYNEYRGHTTLGGAVPAVIYLGEPWDKPAKSAKTLPTNLERRVFPDTQITAYRLAA